MEKIQEILNQSFWGNSIEKYLIAIFLFFGLFVLFRFFRLIIIQKAKIFFEKTKNDFDDLVVGIFANISKFFYWFLALYFALTILKLPEKLHFILNKALFLAVVYEITIGLSQIIDYFVKKLSRRKDESSKTAFLALGKFVKWFLWIGAILTVLSNFGINITTLAAGLGIGGLAVAFAFQSILKDLFSYFTILLDKPVRLGDTIKIGDKTGKVVNIGLKTTRLEALDGEEIILANDQITSNDFFNYGKGKYRRVVYRIGVSYNTPVKQLKKIKKDIQKIIEKIDKENVEFNRCHLKNMEDSSLVYEVVYYINTRDYALYMDINEKINLKILELFEKEGIEIPYPTYTVYTRKD